MASAKRTRKATAARKPAAKTAAAPRSASVGRQPKPQDETVIVTVDGKRVNREKFNSAPVDETVIVTVDGKRVNRRDFTED